jgi:pimeloyl-ACP methyl ester carboxylesterase
MTILLLFGSGILLVGMSKKIRLQKTMIFAMVFAIFVSSSTVVLSPSSPSHNNNSIGIAYAQQQNDGRSINNNNNIQTVNFLTDDGVSIIGSYYSPLNVVNNASSTATATTPTIILLHMLGKDRSTWNTFASTLSQKEGYAVLSIDLRGHGESVKQNDGNTISFQSFTPDDYNKMVLDVKAAKQFLITTKNSNPNYISIVGASIGANIAINYAALDPTIKSVVLLSPGINYRGVSTEQAITKYKNNSIYIAATEGDSEAADSSKILCEKINCDGNLKIYSGGSNSHGTNMFSDQLLNPPLQDLVLSWLAK